MNEYDITLEAFLDSDKELTGYLDQYSVCESLILPVEEGLGDKIKAGIKSLAKKFHDLFVKFKNWVKNAIKKIKEFFTRKKKNKEESKEEGTKSTGDSPSEKSPKKNSDTETAKSVIQGLSVVLDNATEVDESLQKATSDNTEISTEEIQNLQIKAKEASEDMQDAKKDIETKYFALPAKGETTPGKKEEVKLSDEVKRYRDSLTWKEKSDKFAKENNYYTQDESKDIQEQAAAYAWKNPFKFKNFDSDLLIPTRDFLIAVMQREKDNDKMYFTVRNVGFIVNRIRDALEITKERGPIDKEGLLNMHRYMETRIPSALKKYINSNKDRIDKMLKRMPWLIEGSFEYYALAPTKQNLIKAINSILSR